MNYDDNFTYDANGMVDISDDTNDKKSKNNFNTLQNPKKAYIPEEYTDINNTDILNNLHNFKDEQNKKKKKILIISSVAASVVVALCVTGFCLWQGGIFNLGDKNKEFIFSQTAYVSGISLADKTVEQAKSLLEANKTDFIEPISISIDANDEIFELNETDFEYTYDIDEVLAQMKANETDKDKSNDEKTYKVTALVTSESIIKNAKDIKAKIDTEPENAFVSEFKPYASERFIYTEAKAGFSLDEDTLVNDIGGVFAKKVKNSTIKAYVEPIEADITVSDIKNNVVKLATYETVSYNTANGNSNMKVSLAACNGSIINPGEIWSFNECTGDSNLESNGYKAANVISEGKLVPGIGGGICQTSSTIYYAAVKANMGIEERYNHMWASTYVPTGLDATIDYPRLDLKLSNPTKYQMFLECKMVDTTLTATIWGYKSPDYDEIVTFNETTSRSSQNYKVKAWRVYCKDGKEINRESLGTSTYDNDRGYIFYPAENKLPKASDDDNTNQSSSSSKPQSSSKPASSSSSKTSSSSSSKPSSTPSATKPAQSSTAPTQKPTEPSTTNPPQTEPSTEPTSETHQVES